MVAFRGRSFWMWGHVFLTNPTPSPFHKTSMVGKDTFYSRIGGEGIPFSLKLFLGKKSFYNALRTKNLLPLIDSTKIFICFFFLTSWVNIRKYISLLFFSLFKAADKTHCNIHPSCGSCKRTFRHWSHGPCSSSFIEPQVSML